MSRAPAVSQLSGDSIELPPRRPIGLIAIVLVLDLGLAAAGAVMLAKGLAHDKPAATPAPQKTEALTPAPELAPAAASAPSLPTAVAIATAATPADPPPAEEAKPEAKTATVAADKSSASRRAKEKERAPTKTKQTTATKATSSSSSSGPVTSPSGSAGPTTHPQDPYADATPAPKLTTEQEVEKLYAKSKGTFDRCLGAAGTVHGRIQVAFQVLADGHVANAAAVENSTGNAELGRCLVATISGWAVAPHSSTALSFVKPFNYP